MKSRILEVLAAAIFVAGWVLAVQTIPGLPQRVATHFDWNGVADGYDSAASLWVLPVIATVVYLSICAAQRMPGRRMNVPVKITDQNREAVYAIGREMLPVVKISTMLTILAVEWGTLDSAVRGTLAPHFAEFIVALLALTLSVAIYYTLKMRAA